MTAARVHQRACPKRRTCKPHSDRTLHRQINLLARRLDEQQWRWFAALEAMRIGHGDQRLLTQSTNNVSGLELRHHLGVCYKTAWLLKHKLMEVMRPREDARQITGRVAPVDPASAAGRAEPSVSLHGVTFDLSIGTNGSFNVSPPRQVADLCHRLRHLMQVSGRRNRVEGRQHGDKKKRLFAMLCQMKGANPQALVLRASGCCRGLSGNNPLQYQSVQCELW